MWNQIKKTNFLKIDWKSQDNTKLADPYLLWADTSKLSGSVDIGYVRLVFELDLRSKKNAKKQFNDFVGKLIRLGARNIEFSGLYFPPLLPKHLYYFSIILATESTKEVQAIVVDLRNTGTTIRYEIANIERVVPIVNPLAPAAVVSAKVVPAHHTRTKIGGNVIAIIDDGCPLAHANFRTLKNKNWSSRIAYFWDQGTSDEAIKQYDAPTDAGYGQEISSNDLDLLLERFSTNDGIDEESFYAHLGYSAMFNSITHGAHVLDAAAGSPPDQPISDESSNAKIIFVQLPREAVRDTSGASLNFYVLEAIYYILQRIKSDANLVLNISYGAFAGSHDGKSILESAMDHHLKARSKYAITLPAGNAYNAACHSRIQIPAGETKELKILVSSEDATESFVEFWYEANKKCDIEFMVTPPGTSPGLAQKVQVDEAFSLSDTRWGGDNVVAMACHLETTSKGSGSVMLLALSPTIQFDNGPAARSGTWTVTVTNKGNQAVDLNCWIERDDTIMYGSWPSRQAVFEVAPTSDPNAEYPTGTDVQKRGTLSNIACGQLPLVIGGHFETTGETAPYSASGPTRSGARKGPDGTVATDYSWELSGMLGAGTRSGSVVRLNGTSVAAPKVARHVLNWLADESRVGNKPDIFAIRNHVLGNAPTFDERIGIGKIPGLP